jgi:hypothetical protein
MTDFIPSMAPLSALFFLGTGFVLLICALILAYAAIHRSNRLLAIAGEGGIFVIAATSEFCWDFSLMSREVDLPFEAKKYFRELDCHISYAVEPVGTPSNVGE